jgi:hypothetical protein
MKNILAVVAIAISLTACAQAARQDLSKAQLAQVERDNQIFLLKRDSCRNRRNESRFHIIRSHIAVDSAPTVSQMADNQKPNAAERALLLEWGDLLTECRTTFSPSDNYPWHEFQIAIASLASGETTYGAHNRRIAEFLAATKTLDDAQREQASAQAAQAAAQRAMVQAQADAAAIALADGFQ